MTVRDLIGQNIDIDVYDNVCEELVIAFCGPLTLTPEGAEKFEDVMDYGIILENPGSPCMIALVDVDGPDGAWQKRLRKAKEFFEAAAGYCTEAEYSRWFAED